MTAAKNPKPLGLPLTLSAEQVLANEKVAHAMDQKRLQRRRGISATALQPAEANPFAADASGSSGLPTGTRAERDAAALKASYRVGDTTPSKIDLRRGDIPGPMLLEVTAIDVYQDNPRLFRNEKRDDIKASIQAQGFHDALVVTRRREGDRYMLAAGSNTTLDVLKELWNTTGDERFRWVNCIFQPFEDDARVMAQHLGENLNRGDMKFWEIATGMMKLVELLQAERLKVDPGAKPMSIREMTEALVSRGLKADKTSVARWQFATDRLHRLGAAAARLTRLAAEALQPRLLACRALSGKFGISEASYWSEIVDPVLQGVARAVEADSDEDIDADLLCNQVEAALAERVHEPVLAIRQMLSVLKVSPELTLADLRIPSPSLVAGAGPTAGQPVVDQGSAAFSQSPAPVQRPLPLPPGAVRAGAKSPDASGNEAARTGNPGPAAPPTAAVAAAVSGSAAPPSSHGPLFASAPSGTDDAAIDPLQALHKAIESLLAASGLSDTLRLCDPMPLGFYVELPDPALHARQRVEIGSPGHQQRLLKTAVWWQLVFMSGQLGEGCVPYIDRKGAFYLHFASDADADPLDGTDIDRDAPEVQQSLLARLAPGAMRQVARQMRTVEELASQVFERLPERWRRMKEVQPNVF